MILLHIIHIYSLLAYDTYIFYTLLGIRTSIIIYQGHSVRDIYRYVPSLWSTRNTIVKCFLFETFSRSKSVYQDQLIFVTSSVLGTYHLPSPMLSLCPLILWHSLPISTNCHDFLCFRDCTIAIPNALITSSNSMVFPLYWRIPNRVY